MEPVIKVSGLKKTFHQVKAVDGIDFQVEQGELFGFLGVNGAGKSTTINMLCTLLAPTAGEAAVCGHRLGREDEAIRRQIGVVWQNNCLDNKLTVQENLTVRGSLYGLKGGRLKESIGRVGEKLGLLPLFGRRYEHLSGGQKRRCEIGAALVNTPRLLFLDEPTTGLDSATRQTVWESLEELRQEGVTVFLTTHYMEEAARATHIAVMDSGKIRETGTPFSLKERFARDRLLLVPREEKRGEMAELLARHRGAPGGVGGKEGCLAAEEADGGTFVVTLQDSLAAIPILREAEHCLQGFELVQGSMDDVFLNITGKALEKQGGES